jgi:hypothetical protein
MSLPVWIRQVTGFFASLPDTPGSSAAESGWFRRQPLLGTAGRNQLKKTAEFQPVYAVLGAHNKGPFYGFLNSFHWPRETTSTLPSITFNDDWSSNA